jgi:hypothetical protein
MTMKFKFASIPAVDATCSRILSLDSPSGNGMFYVEYLVLDGGYTGFYVGYKSSAGIANTIAGPAHSSVVLGNWYEIQISFRESGNNVVYLNGTQIISIASAGLYGFPNRMTIGAVYGGANAFNGCVNNIRFYNSIIPAPPGSDQDIYAVVMADSFMAASDARLKKNIVSLDGALDKIDNIRGVYHDWIEPNQPQERQIGLIAQELQAVYPELVMQGGNGFLAVNYPKLTAVLLQSIKELKAMVLEIAKK